MSRTHQEMICSWFNKLQEDIASVKEARGKSERGTQQNAMLAGKLRAYVQMANYLVNKYGSSIDIPEGDALRMRLKYPNALQ